MQKSRRSPRFDGFWWFQNLFSMEKQARGGSHDALWYDIAYLRLQSKKRGRRRWTGQDDHLGLVEWLPLSTHLIWTSLSIEKVIIGFREIRYHFCREHLKEKLFEVTYCPTETMVADIFTKPLALPTSRRHVSSLSMISKLLSHLVPCSFSLSLIKALYNLSTICA